MSDLTTNSDSPLPVEIVSEAPQSRNTATFTRNAVINLARLLISTAVALVLPAYLTHKLPLKTYGAWVLILQMSAYVGYLDFGVQTGISKYVAEFEARGDSTGASKRASAGLAIMLCTSLIGIVLTLALVWRVPSIFGEMPVELHRDVRISLLCVGLSLSFGLFFSVYSSIFLGLQRYSVPTVLSLINRFLFTGVVVGAVYLHSNLAWMGALVAVVNVVTGLLQYVAWKKYASRVQLTLRNLDHGIVQEMLGYCAVLAIWTAGYLCVSGLDVTIVGKYAYDHTGYYSIATQPTNFMLSIMGAALGPFMPTASALSVSRNALQMGDVLKRTTRYSTILLVGSGVVLMVTGYWLLRLWVGPVYALQSVGFLRILVLANVVRCVCLPYAGMLVATNSQKVALASVISEAIVNLVASVFLARHLGAIGVAYGTLIGSFVSVGMHFGISMHFTFSTFSVTRLQLFLSGIVRPLLLAVPSAILWRWWWTNGVPPFDWPYAVGWLLATGLLTWYGTLNAQERVALLGLGQAKMKRLTAVFS